MRLHRFFISGTLHSPTLVLTDQALCKQWINVLRLRTGDRIVLCDGNGNETEAVLEELTKKQATVRPGTVRTVDAEPLKHTTLYCAILRRENFEWVVQKATEVGVKEIVPLLTERTVKTGIKPERLRTIAREAAEQSGRGTIPVIREPRTFADAIATADANHLFYCCSNDQPNGKQSPISNPSIRLRTSQQSAISLWIGPEGGWSENEVTAAARAGMTMATLGSLTLRAETAAVIATYLAVVT